MAKLPPIPFTIIENLRGEEPVVIAGFINILTFWVKRGIIEPLETARIEKLSLLGREEWKQYGTIVSERVIEITEPFILYWKKYHCKSGVYDKKAMAMRKAKALRRALIAKHVTNVTELTIKDAADEFSRLPVKLSHDHPSQWEGPQKTDQLTRREVIKQQKKTPKTAFKTGLKDNL